MKKDTGRKRKLLKSDKIFEKKALFFENIGDDGRNFWFSEFDYNALFKIDKESWKAEFIGFFPNENFVQERLYISMAMYYGKIYFAPHNADEIAVYDIERKKFKKIPIPIPRKREFLIEESGKFFRTVSVEEKVYFIPYYYPGILCYDTKNDVFSYFDDWINEIEEKRVNQWGYFLEVIFVENRLILPCACADAVVILDLSVQKSYILNTEKTSYLCKFCGICYANKYFYLISADGTIQKRKLKEEKEEIKIIKLPNLEFDEIEFYPVKSLNEYIYLFPFGQNKGIRFNMNNEQWEVIDWFSNKEKFEKKWCQFLFAFPTDGKLYAETGNSHYLVEYDFNYGNKYKKQLFPSPKDSDLIEKQAIQEFVEKIEYAAVRENTVFSLKFILYVLQKYNDYLIENIKNKRKDNGKEIYCVLMK